ncbi:hypothetical protein TNCV_2500101 [Trichonephila clavipes]|nr:hypothetical protein TNCV_2500101 [Trichonephila clavipes]
MHPDRMWPVIVLPCNIQVSSGTKNNFSPNEPSCTTVTVSFNAVLFGGNGYLALSILKTARIRLRKQPDSSENITQHHCLWCPQCVFSTPG